MRLVIGGGVSTRKTDPTLLKAVARGHKWFNELVSSREMFTQEIAAREIEPAAVQYQSQARRIVGTSGLDPALLIEGQLLAQEQILGLERSSGTQAETQKVD